VKGSVSLTNNGTTTSFTIPVTGTGASNTHDVVLTWEESSTDIVGYNVYRSTVSGSSYTKLTSSTVSTESYTDETVVGGTTYYYVVTAVNSSSVESAYSSQVTATVPST
jgi:fibronectin type 3 domain-containing protein